MRRSQRAERSERPVSRPPCQDENSYTTHSKILEHNHHLHHKQEPIDYYYQQTATTKITSISHALLANTNLKMLAASIIVAVTILLQVCLLPTSQAQGISIRPSDFERLIMPCFLGGGYGQNLASSGGGGAGSYGASIYNAPSSLQNGPQPSGIGSGSLSGAGGFASSQYGRQNNERSSSGGPAYYGTGESSGTSASRLSAANQPPTSYIGSSNAFNSGGIQSRDGLTNNLGQSVPRANTIDNFIALVTKIEVANPRLARDPDALIRSLLGRFHLDNYYYDVRMRTPISEQDRRYTDILPALLSSPQSQFSPMDMFPEQLLDQDEKCSMYFMLSHFIDKSSSSSPSPGYAGANPPLYQVPVQQLAGPQYGQRPPSLQAAGAGYPGQSANAAYSAGASGSRYPGPAPSFGSPATGNMNSFGTGISNTNPEYTGKSPYGVNTPNTGVGGQQYNTLLANNQLRNPSASFPGAAARPPYIDASRTNSQGQRGGTAGVQIDDRIAIEYGVVTLPNQENAALVLNRVLMGLLAASTPAQTIRQLASAIYPNHQITPTPKLDEEIDPLFATTLADLWAIGAIPKPGKPFDVRLLGDNGHWNDTMCPTSFTLERASSIKFTTAELLGGLDGFNLGMLRRRLISMRRTLKLSEILRIYYSKNGFRPQLAEFGVCQRNQALMSQMDDLHRQAENYLRLYQLNSPMSDQDISQMIQRLDYFREFARQSVQQYEPRDLCQETQSDLYPVSSQDQCEISRADVVTVLDTSPQANTPFMQLVVAKLAQRLGLSRDTNSLSILTNQQDSSGYAGAYSFNAIVRNSTNLGEIGCALTHDTSSAYQGGQVSDPTRLMEMFERALVNLDSEYLTRQQIGGIGAGLVSTYSSNNRQSFVSTWFNQQGDPSGVTPYMPGGPMGGPRNSGGAKVIIWFNYGQQARPASAASGPTNWAPGGSYNAISSSSYNNVEYKFYEAKKYLRENFRGASILAVSPNRDEVKAFVYDEERDIFTDVPGGLGGALGSTADIYPPSQDLGSNSALSGPADSLTNKLLQRMCTIPSLFQYPMCFRVPSSNEMSVGYISPGRKQYWMMSPKTFFASRSIRLVFRVEGGRLRVCFGRQPNPDETAQRNQQNNQQYQPSAIAFSSNNQQSIPMNGQQSSGGSVLTTPPPQSSSSDYYTGLEYGVCKDVGLNQEIDFMISDPCWRESIAECKPFYFVIREISQPGEGDPNYMCRDSGCKRFDQAKFVLSHTGVSCSSAFRSVQANWFLILISILSVSLFSSNYNFKLNSGHLKHALAFTLFACYVASIQFAEAQQQAGVYDFGQNRYGEKRGDSTPLEWLAIILILMLILAGLALTVGLCYYVTKKARDRGTHTPLPQEEY